MRFTRQVAWFLPWFGALMVWVLPAKAETPPLAITFVTCDATLSTTDVLRIAQLELATDLEASAATTDAKIDVQCAPDAALVRAARRGTTLEKRMAFDTLDAAARARLVALGIAELARELARTKAPPPVIAAPKPAPPARVPSAAKPPRTLAYALSLGPTFRYELKARMSALGLRMIGERRAGSWLSLTLAADGMTAERAIAGGSLRFDHAALELGARAFFVLGFVRFYAEAAMAGAIEQLKGEASERGVRGASFSTVNALTRAGLGSEVSFFRRGVAALTIGGHYMLRTLRARNDGERTTQLGPWLLGASLTAGARW